MDVRAQVKHITDDIKARDEKTFALLCAAAADANELELRRVMMEKKVDIDFRLNHIFHDAETVTMKMAELNNDEAVDLLTGEFKARIGDAVEGYARAKLQEKVEFYLLKYDVMQNATRGYAYVGEEDLVNNLLGRGANSCDAAYSYARSGNLPALQRLFARKDMKQDALYSAVKGGAHSGLIEFVESVILLGAPLLKPRESEQGFFEKIVSKKFDPIHELSNVAVGAFACSSYFVDANKVIKLLASIVNDSVFKTFSDFIKSNKDLFKHARYEMSASEIIDKSTTLRRAMLDHKMSYDQVLTSGVLNVKSENKMHLFKRHKKLSSELVWVGELKEECNTSDAKPSEQASPNDVQNPGEISRPGV